MTIANGDLPAMPITSNENICRMTGTSKREFSGFTKREQIAAMALQGMLATTEAKYLSARSLAHDAVSFADALLAELERRT